MVSMVSTAAFSRIKASITFAILLATFIACGGTLIPDYGKTIYKSAEPVDYEKYEDQTGYPAGAGYEELTSREEIIEAEENYIIKVEAENLEATTMYKELSGTGYYIKKTARYEHGNTEGGVGTFYVAKLKDGHKMLVFIDDRAFTIPKSGIIKLPVASTKKLKNEKVLHKLAEITGLSQDELTYYVDVAGKWREGEDGQKIEERAMERGVLTFILAVFPCGFLFNYIEKLGAKKENE